MGHWIRFLLSGSWANSNFFYVLLQQLEPAVWMYKHGKHYHLEHVWILAHILWGYKHVSLYFLALTVLSNLAFPVVQSHGKVLKNLNFTKIERWIFFLGNEKQKRKQFCNIAMLATHTHLQTFILTMNEWVETLAPAISHQSHLKKYKNSWHVR